MKKTLLTLALVGLSAVATYAQGTISFLNSALSRVSYQDVIGGPIVNTTAPAGLHIGIFWGDAAGGAAAVEGMGRGTLALPTATTTVGGLWNVGATYPIPGSQEGQRVWLKVAGWAGGSATSLQGLTHYGESAVVNVVLGPTAGPGTVVWQGTAGTATDRAKPFVITPIPEPSVIALGALGLGALLLRRRKA
jgi:hypothetical protein